MRDRQDIENSSWHLPVDLMARRLKNLRIRVEFFYSRTCPHCLPTKRILYELVKDLEKTIEIEEIDAWSEKGEPLAQKYGVQVVPTIVVDGVKRAEGVLSREQLISVMKEALNQQGH